jgi:hypothetical protein
VRPGGLSTRGARESGPPRWGDLRGERHSLPPFAKFAAALAAALIAAPAWADHPGALRSQGWSPLTAALVFGGLALIVGAIVVVIVIVFTRPEDAAE